MKKLFYVFLALLFFSCAKETTKKPDFLLGYWVRTNDKPDQKTYEIWSPDFTGLGFTLQKSDTIFKEVLSIIEKNDSLFLKVEGVNETPTLFYFTEQTATSFTCENPNNEFPTKIHYALDAGNLKAKVSNSDFSIDFVFEKSL